MTTEAILIVCAVCVCLAIFALSQAVWAIAKHARAMAIDLHTIIVRMDRGPR